MAGHKSTRHFGETEAASKGDKPKGPEADLTLAERVDQRRSAREREVFDLLLSKLKSMRFHDAGGSIGALPGSTATVMATTAVNALSNELLPYVDRYISEDQIVHCAKVIAHTLLLVRRCKQSLAKLEDAQALSAAAYEKAKTKLRETNERLKLAVAEARGVEMNDANAIDHWTKAYGAIQEICRDSPIILDRMSDLLPKAQEPRPVEFETDERSRIKPIYGDRKDVGPFVPAPPEPVAEPGTSADEALIGPGLGREPS